MSKYEETVERLKGMELKQHPLDQSIMLTDPLRLDVRELPPSKAEFFLEGLPELKEVRLVYYTEDGKKYIGMSTGASYYGMPLKATRVPQY